MIVRKLKGRVKQSVSVAMAAMMVASSIPQTASATEAVESDTTVVETQTEESTENEDSTEESTEQETTEEVTEETKVEESTDETATEETKVEESTEEAITEEVTDVEETEDVAEEETTEVETEDAVEEESEEVIAEDDEVDAVREEVEVQETSGTVVYEGTESVKTDIDFSELDAEDWNNGKVTIAYPGSIEDTIELGNSYKVGAKVTIDADAYATLSASESNYIKFQGVVKLGSDWTYTTGDSWPALYASNFTQDGDNYTADIEVEFADKAGTLKEIDFEIVGVGFKGEVTIDDIKVTNEPVSYEVVVYENSNNVVVEDIDFSELDAEDWNNGKATVVYSSSIEDTIELGNSYKVGAKITIDADAYATLSESENNYIKFQGVVKLGSDWTYTTGDSWPALYASSFIQDGDSYTADIEVEFADKAGTLKEIDFEIVGVGFTGVVNISNVKITNITTEEPELEEREPSVISDFSTEDDYNKWTTETGWDYYHGGTENSVPEIAYDSENQRLKVTLDYSANAASGWSEAKVKFVAPEGEGVDVSQYNQISVDIIYPDELDGTKMKFFTDGIINKDTAVDESTAEDLGNGMKKVTVTMGFSPSATPLESLTIGIIGVSTSFKGDVYLDNLVLSQKSATEDFVEITSVAGEGSAATITNAPTSIKLTDEDATASTKALYAYLQGIANSNQVLFGHQNDVNSKVGTNELGDVYDITGQVSGIYGLDSLSLTGSEAGGTDSASALANSIANSKAAVDNGAIVSLSTHMPNFSNKKIVKTENGYDFFGCDFSESKDLSNEVAKKILPGGEYNEVYKAYLDIVVEYAKEMNDYNGGTPIIFRPLHENSGTWFWWGATNTVETYQSLFRYTKDYIESQGVHNLIWVYSPNGPVASEEEYLKYYPGDEYVDILAFDYYDDYNTYPATSDGSYFDSLDKTCEVISGLAAKKDKVAAISECGVRVMKADGSGNDGLLVKGNPVREEVTQKNWYEEVNRIAKENNMPYYLVWANFSDTNFYVPYKYDANYGHEMINEFIDFYNDESTIFGGDADFYENVENLNPTVNEYTNPRGYMVTPFDMDTILEATTIQAMVENAAKVQFVVEDTQTGTKVTLDATKADGKGVADADLWSADLTDAKMQEVGKTEVASITLMADDVELAKLTNIALGKEKEKAPAHVFDNFEYYSGSDSLLDVSYSANSAAGCSSGFVLDETNKVDGTYGGAFKYVLETTGSEVWTGRIKQELVSGDFSAYNALEMWVKPDGNGQKLVVQLVSNGEDFEAYLSDFVKGTEAQYVTIPFSSFKGKNGGTFDAAHIDKFAIWCNSIIPEGYEGTWKVDSAIYFDGIQAISLTEEQLAANPVDKNGLIITDASLTKGGSSAVTVDKTALETAINTYKDYKEDDYTAESWTAFAKALADAESVVAKEDATQEEVDAAKAALEDAKEALVAKEPTTETVDKTDLNTLITECKELKETDYTAESWPAFAKALTDAEAVSAKAEATQAEVDAAKTALDAAKTALVAKEPTTETADKTALNTLITECKELKEADYTAESWTEFAKALTDAETVSSKADATQAEVDAAKKALEDAKTALKVMDSKPEEEKVGLWAEDIADVVFTGSAFKPEVTVYDGSTLLKLNKDYTVKYFDNKNVGTARIEITGKGNYTGKIEKTFNILAKNLADEDITADNLYTSASKNNNKVKVNPVVKRDGKKLKAGKDYTVELIDKTEGAYVAAGTYVVRIQAVEGKGYTGYKDITITLAGAEQVLMSKVKIDKIDAQKYAGTEIRPQVVVKDGRTPLVENTDYTVEYSNNIEVGTATVTVKGTGAKYVGEKIATFKIEGTALKKNMVSVPGSVVYTGAEIEPAITIEGLTLGKDYIVEYDNNTAVGKATVVVTGINNYSGTVKKTFKITPFDIKANADNKFVIVSKNITAAYAKGGSKPSIEVTFNGETMTEGTDYTLAYKNNKKADSTGTITIKGKGNFAGSVKDIQFKITKQNLANLDATANDIIEKNAGKYSKTNPVIVDTDGKKLKNKNDYVVTDYTFADGSEIKETPKVGDVVRVTAEGKGNYEGTVTADFKVIANDKNLSKAKIQVVDQGYTGEAIEPTGDVVSVSLKMNGEWVKLREGVDYEIVGYSKNINKGKAKITVRGIGEYGGTKTGTFKIIAQTMSWAEMLKSLFN